MTVLDRIFPSLLDHVFAVVPRPLDVAQQFPILTCIVSQHKEWDDADLIACRPERELQEYSSKVLS